MLVLFLCVNRGMRRDSLNLISRDLWSGNAALGRGSGPRWEGGSPFASPGVDPVCTPVDPASVSISGFKVSPQ